MNLWLKVSISNHLPSKVFYEITYPFPNLTDTTVEDWEWIDNFTPHLMIYVNSYPGVA